MSDDNRVRCKRWRWPEWRSAEPVFDPVSESDFRWVAVRALRLAGTSLPYKCVQPLADRARDLVLGDPVIPWAEWRTTGPGSVHRPSAAAAVVEPPDGELLQALARLRADFMWLNHRRRRMYGRPLPHHAFDVEFCRWLRSLDAEAVLTYARRFLAAWSEDTPLEFARARLALLRPMPLALLWPAHVFRCAHTDVLAGCETMDDVGLEYMTLFAAVHACRALAADQRANARRYRFPPELWAPERGLSEPPERYATRMLDECDLQLLPSRVAKAFVRTRANAERRGQGDALHWRPVLGPQCSRCREAQEVTRLAGSEEQGYRPTLPPFRAGCLCELVFDPENDPFMEAPWEEDVARWARERRHAAEFPGMRVLLGLSQQPREPSGGAAVNECGDGSTVSEDGRERVRAR